MSLNTIIEEENKKFDEKFGELWSGMKIVGGNYEDPPPQWAIIDKESIKSHLTSALTRAYKQALEDVESKLPKERETCDCEEDPGYHLKECNLMPFGFNNAIEQVVSIIKSLKGR